MSAVQLSYIQKMIAIGVVACAVSAQAETIYKPVLRLGLEERYDSDFLLRRDNPAANGQMVTKLLPQVGLEVKDHTWSGAGFYAADIFIFHGLGTAGVDHRGGVEYKQAADRTTSIETRFRIWRVTDPTSLPRLGVAREIAPVLFGTAELGLAVRLSPRTTVRAAYLFEGLKIYDTAGRAPSFLNSPYLEAWYRATHTTDIGVDYRFQYFTLDNANASSHSVAALYRYQFTRHLRFTGKAGPGWFQRPGDPSHSGWFPRVNLELAHNQPLFEVLLVVGHDLVGATGYTTALWADFAALTASYRVSREVGVFANASYFRNGRAPNEGIDSLSYQSGVSQGYVVGGGLEWRLTQFFSLQGFVSRIAQVAGPTTGIDYSRNIAAIRMSVTTF